ncbi:PREDICTED: uncharacterized protein LOC105456415 [Wasmannia auropunctata]|uniref:uncharacterized protein LOC105456415 n=1 Tax=Wasmannia auropunctata TaxID=64793 RepID=UPI0005F03721|nr:PREDICTED: uncharacterized protein LOC105456415 [Wasmannia auropunctata]
MKLILKDNEPVYQSPRRLSQMQKDIVNKQIEQWIAEDRYPLPLIKDQLDFLQGAKIFSTLDLKNGFFHVRMDEDSRKFTAFIVPDGHFEFLRVPFGLCNSPAVFQKFINTVFKDLIREGKVLTYMDDLIVLAQNHEDALRNLELVLKTASEARLIINWKKCCFLQEKVEFLGHVIEGGCVRPSPKKVKAVMSFPEPTTIQQLQSFLGLTGYFQKFILNYSIIARPLTNLLRAGVKFFFGETEKAAFAQLKSKLSEKPVLGLYKIGAETELHTDASKYGYGAILFQRNSDDQLFHPIYYASGKTTLIEENTLGFNAGRISIEHRSGKSVPHVDALSRNPLSSCFVIDESEEGFIARFRKAKKEDSDIKKICDLASQGQSSDYIIRGGLLFKEDAGDFRLVVPKVMQSQIIREAHEKGHFSINKTEILVRRDYWICNLRSKVEKVVRNCITCILAERKQGKLDGLLNPIEKGSLPLDTFHVDHLGSLPSTKKSYKHILVIVDAFSKFTWLFATKSTSTVEVLSCMRKLAAIFGNPRRIISDRGTAFTSKDFEEYCRQENIVHCLTTAGVPRSNGQVERVNRTLIPLLTKLAAPKSQEWYKYLDIAQQYLNTTTHRSINNIPFNILFETHARLREDIKIKELLENEMITIFQENRDEERAKASESIAKIQCENKRIYGKRRKNDKKYHEGDIVAIKRTQQGPGLKLAHKFLGPYEIIKVLQKGRYNVRKIGEQEGPLYTSTAADFMKPWIEDNSEESSFEDVDENIWDEC